MSSWTFSAISSLVASSLFASLRISAWVVGKAGRPSIARTRVSKTDSRLSGASQGFATSSSVVAGSSDLGTEISMPALADPKHRDRTQPVEAYAVLLWFPTGGGKTEAYLGVAAFTMVIRRLQGKLGDYDASRGLAVVMRTSSDWVRQPNGSWVRAKIKQTRGLNQNRSPVLKSIFKGAATTVVAQPSGRSALRDKYQRLLDGGTKPNLAKLTIARKIAAIALRVWKDETRYDDQKHRERLK